LLRRTGDAATLTRHYSELTAEERFRLILAAGAHGDGAEQERLAAVGGRLTLTMRDHAPFGHAYYEPALLTYIDLSESAAKYREALHRADDAEILNDDESEDDLGDAEAEAAEAEADGTAADETAEAEAQTLAEQFFNFALAEGFMLKVKGDGWKLWCERMGIPPFAAWEGLPGLDRLQWALRLADQSAFTAVGVLRWLNEIAPAGQPVLRELPKALTGEAHAAATEKMFRERVKRWGG
jgi:hypothetical protein